MTQLQTSEFSCLGDLEEIITWGTSPMKHLLYFMDTYIEEHQDDKNLDVMMFFKFEFEDKIDEIEKAIHRFINAMRKKQGKPELKEAA